MKEKVLALLNNKKKIIGFSSVFFSLTLLLVVFQNCGKKGTSLISATIPPVSIAVQSALLSDCPNGGITIISYQDKNTNGSKDLKDLQLTTQNVCNGTNGVNGNDGKGAGIFVESAHPRTCPAGGIQVTTFIDDNNNGSHQDEEAITSISSVCNGTNGSNGESAQITVTAATLLQCANGGSVYSTSTDSTPVQSTVVCNGANGTDGQDGENGEDGEDGESSFITSTIANPSQCPTGGTVFAVTNGSSDPIYSIVCNGANGANGQNAYITTTVAAPFQCANGGVVVATWVDNTSPTTEIICNGAQGAQGQQGSNGSSATISTAVATSTQCENGGVVITTTNPNSSPVENIVCNGATGAAGASGSNGTNVSSYLTGIVGPQVNGKAYSACHHDFLYLNGTNNQPGWLIFRHQKNGTADQGVGKTGFNVWNVDISNFSLVSEVGNVTYCNLQYNAQNKTLSYTVVDNTDGLRNTTGTIDLTP
jgi:hypothetical protein